MRLLEKSDAQRVTLIRDEMHTGLSAACILMGAVLVATGLYLAIRESRSLPRTGTAGGDSNA